MYRYCDRLKGGAYPGDRDFSIGFLHFYVPVLYGEKYPIHNQNRLPWIPMSSRQAHTD